MYKEPIGLYIFRIALSLIFLGLLFMLYWSSILIEQDLKFLRQDVKQVQSDLVSLRTQIGQTPRETTKEQSVPSSEIGSTFPNLLTEDPFYQTTLPKLLGPQFKASGIRLEADIGKPDNLHPFSNWVEVASWHAFCTVAVASQHFGIYETLAPDAALRMELRYGANQKPEYWVFLRRDLYWQPLQQAHFSVTLAPHFLRKHPVTAHDFKFYLDAILNPHVGEAQAVALRTYYNDVEDIEVVDDYTFIVRWKTKEIEENGKKEQRMQYTSKGLTAGLRPLASFVYQYFTDGTKIITDDQDPHTYRNNSVWAQNFSHHWANNIIVSCGGWTFNGMTDREIRFRRNPDFYEPQAVLVDALEIKFKDSPDTVWQDFREGTLDLFNVPPNQLAEVERFLESPQGASSRMISYVNRSYAYIGWNQTRSFFQSKKVRQALTMAIDRQRIIQQYLNGMGIEITGTFFRFSPSYDENIKPYPFDPQKARRLLEEEGWYDSDGDGIIDRDMNGQRVPFRFTLTYYVKNPTNKAICEYIATALHQIGIEVDLNGVDIADLSAIFEDKNFDAISLGWGLGTPPENPRQLWGSQGAKERGSSNAVGFANQDIDQIIDRLDYEYDPKKRVALYHSFDRILYDEAPYVFLYTPKANMVYRTYLQNVFIPAERQDLIPGANVAEPQSSIFWIDNRPLSKGV